MIVLEVDPLITKDEKDKVYNLFLRNNTVVYVQEGTETTNYHRLMEFYIDKIARTEKEWGLI